MTKFNLADFAQIWFGFLTKYTINEIASIWEENDD